MPYIGVTKTDRLVLPSNPDYWVDMKHKCAYGDRSAAQKAMLLISQVDLCQVSPDRMHLVEADPETGRGVMTEVEMDAFFSTLLVRLITAWNLDGEDLQVMPINRDSIALLDSMDGEFLQTEALNRLRRRPVVVERPFAGPSPLLSRASGSRNRKL